MRSCFRQLVLVGLIIAGSASPVEAHHTSNIMESAADPHRRLVVCSNMNILKDQLAMVEIDGYWDRQLIIVAVIPDVGTAAVSPGEVKAPDGRSRVQRGDLLIAEQLCSLSDNKFVLIDKDKSEIGRWESPVSSDVLFSLIDGYPN